MQETRLTDLYQVENFNDTFALGHYARVLDAVDRRGGQLVALKVLRPEHLNFERDPGWEYLAFANEADLLHKMAGSKYVVRLLDCGYITSPEERPTDGSIVSYQADVLGFVRDARVFAERKWRPYLALENLPRTENLYYLMKTSTPGVRWRLPTEEVLDLALQFSSVLKLAHKQRIVYLDHKLEHVYWDGLHLRIIDWNSSRQVEGTSAQTAQLFQTDLHHLTVGILYPILVGLLPNKNSLAPQPASLQELDKRYADVDHLDFGMEPSISFRLQQLLQRGASRDIASIEAYVDQLAEVAGRLGWDFPHNPTSDALRDARAHTRAGLKRLREGQDAIREARDLLREAAILDNINEDVELELRRLLGEINEMLARRVIP